MKKTCEFSFLNERDATANNYSWKMEKSRAFGVFTRCHQFCITGKYIVNHCTTRMIQLWIEIKEGNPTVFSHWRVNNRNSNNSNKNINKKSNNWHEQYLDVGNKASINFFSRLRQQHWLTRLWRALLIMFVVSNPVNQRCLLIGMTRGLCSM